MVAQPASRFEKIDAELDGPTGCKLCRFITTAPAEDSRYIDALLRQPDKGHAHIERVLSAGGIEISASSIKRHRTKHLAA